MPRSKQQQKGKQSKPDEDQDNKADRELGKSESLVFKRKGGGHEKARRDRN